MLAINIFAGQRATLQVILFNNWCLSVKCSVSVLLSEAFKRDSIEQNFKIRYLFTGEDQY